MAVQAPKTVGPNMAGTLIERAEQAYALQQEEALGRARTRSLRVARDFFGRSTPIAVDEDFVPESFVRRLGQDEWRRVSVAVDDLHFQVYGKDDALHLIERCAHCLDGVLICIKIETIADIARWFAHDHSDIKCQQCPSIEAE